MDIRYGKAQLYESFMIWTTRNNDIFNSTDRLWPGVRDGDSDSNGEAGEEDGSGRTEDGEVGIGGDKKAHDKK